MPSKRTTPDVGSMRRRMARPVVVLPQPDSPTSAERLARRDVERHAVHGAHLPRDAAEDAPA